MKKMSPKIYWLSYVKKIRSICILFFATLNIFVDLEVIIAQNLHCNLNPVQAFHYQKFTNWLSNHIYLEMACVNTNK